MRPWHESLLLYLETCAVDNNGRVCSTKMREPDFVIAEEWNKSGFVRFGRIEKDSVTGICWYWCELSDAAWNVAHDLRRARGKQGVAHRSYKRTSEV